jgi:ketosteroid isomerase-like protein
MSQENVKLVVGQFEALNIRDFAAITGAWVEDVTLMVHGDLGLVGVAGRDVVNGKEAVGEWFGDWFRQFARDYRFAIDESRDLGDQVVVVATHHARGRTSGVPVTIQSGYLYTVRYGKITRIELWADSAGALEAAGIPE